jgi:putative two-component system response regulator
MSAIKKVLIIDDEKMLHSMLKSVLGAHDIEVISAFTGEEGLLMAASQKPNLIFLDVIMPGMKGREVCERLKSDPLTHDIPVLFLTAKNSEDDVQAELAAGATGHITKPINSASLVREVKKSLGIIK